MNEFSTEVTPTSDTMLRSAAVEGVECLLRYIEGNRREEPLREGLHDTPKRFIRAWDELTEGYRVDLDKVFTIFEDDDSDEIVIIRDIEFQSVCEHHLLPFTGIGHVAYLPQGKLIGASKPVRILHAFARRLQIQERIGQQVTKIIDERLQPKGSACILKAEHQCMKCRGVKSPSSSMVTSSLTGVFKEDTATRLELLHLLKL